MGDRYQLGTGRCARRTQDDRHVIGLRRAWLLLRSGHRRAQGKLHAANDAGCDQLAKAMLRRRLAGSAILGCENDRF